MFNTYRYITYALLLTMYIAPCAAADTASQQQEQIYCLRMFASSDDAQITTEADIAAILSDYPAGQDPTKPHKLPAAQAAALNNALANYCGVTYPGLSELTKKTDLE
jgi:hypothetical protein